MADSQSKKREFSQIRACSSSGRFFNRRRGQWGHSKGSINAALAIAATTAPPAANGAAAGANQAGASGADGGGQQLQKQRHGRKRRRHRNSSFSGDRTGSTPYNLPPAVAAALAISTKTPENHDRIDPVGEQSGEKKSSEPGEANGAFPITPPPSTSGSAAANAAGTAGKKKKRRTRRKRRQWKPYYKLTAEERRELEEREEKRAERIRAKRFAHGQPVAPYNTTQFLLRDRELRNGGEPDCGDLDEIVRNIRHHTRSGSCESPGAAVAVASESDIGDLSSDNSDYSYLEREFDNDWLDEQRQRLETMSKDELVKEFMDLQKQYESAQRDMRLKRLSYEEEIEELRRENGTLRSRCGGKTVKMEDTFSGHEDEQKAEAESGPGSADDLNYSSSSSASSHFTTTANEAG